MNISSVNSTTATQSASSNAVEGIRAQEHRLARNVTEVARSESNGSENSTSRDKALIEQREIIQSVQANARSLEAAGQRIGTLIDIQV